MGNFDEKLAKTLGLEKVTGLDKFSLYTGVIGLVGDTIGIGTFAVGLMIPNLPKPQHPPDGGLLITALLGFYFLTLIIWFLIRFERVKRQKRTGVIAEESFRAFDEFSNQEGWGFMLFPVLGGILNMFVIDATVVLSFLSIFISFLPSTLWLYTLSMNPWLSLGLGLFVSAFISQYATFFALVLDKFFY